MEKELTREVLNEDESARYALGLAIFEELSKHSKVSVFFDIFGKLQIMKMEEEAPLPIAYLDSLKEEDAVEELLRVEVDEGLIMNYLKNRAT